MNDKAAALEEILEGIDNIYTIIEEQEETNSEFVFLREQVDQFRAEVSTLQE